MLFETDEEGGLQKMWPLQKLFFAKQAISTFTRPSYALVVPAQTPKGALPQMVLL